MISGRDFTPIKSSPLMEEEIKNMQESRNIKREKMIKINTFLPPLLFNEFSEYSKSR
jgi:hypothetical protein